MKFIYPAVFRKNEDGKYKAFFPDLECCEAEGDTLDDAIDNANEAAYNRTVIVTAAVYWGLNSHLRLTSKHSS